MSSLRGPTESLYPINGRASSSRPFSGRASGVGTEGLGLPSSSALDVPGHAEATLRLHKARVRGLEEEMSKLTLALSGKSRSPSFCVMDPLVLIFTQLESSCIWRMALPGCWNAIKINQ